MLSIMTQGFGKPKPCTFYIKTYFPKAEKCRWYVVALIPYYSAKNKEQDVKLSDAYLELAPMLLGNQGIKQRQFDLSASG